MNRIAFVSVVTLLACTTAALADFIVETRTGQQNIGQYSPIGTTATSSAKSSAAGCTTTGGSSYFSTAYTGRGGKFSVGSQTLGWYSVYTTWCAGANRRANIRYTVNAGGGGGTYLIDQTQAANTWYQIGSAPFKFTASTDNVSVDATFTSSGSGYLDAIRWTAATPGAPTNLTPTNNATEIPLTGAENDLSWSAGNYSSFFDVFVELSVDGNPIDPATKVGSDLTGTTFDPDSLPLVANSVYYWKVVAKNVDKSTAGATWKFTTLPEPATLAFLALGSFVLMRRRRWT